MHVERLWPQARQTSAKAAAPHVAFVIFAKRLVAAAQSKLGGYGLPYTRGLQTEKPAVPHRQPEPAVGSFQQFHRRADKFRHANHLQTCLAGVKFPQSPVAEYPHA